MLEIDCVQCGRVEGVRVEEPRSALRPAQTNVRGGPATITFQASLPEGWTFDPGTRLRARCRLCSAKARVSQLLETLSTESALDLLEELRSGVAARAAEPAPTWDDDEGTKAGIGPIRQTPRTGHADCNPRDCMFAFGGIDNPLPGDCAHADELEGKVVP